MSAIFYTYRDGKREKAFRYETITKIWYTKDHNGNDQISVTTTDKLTHSSWGLKDGDIELTQKSCEEACSNYNKALIKIGNKHKYKSNVKNVGKKRRRKVK